MSSLSVPQLKFSQYDSLLFKNIKKYTNCVHFTAENRKYTNTVLVVSNTIFIAGQVYKALLSN